MKKIYSLFVLLLCSTIAMAQTALMSDEDHRIMMNDYAANLNTVLTANCPQGITIDQFKKKIVNGELTLSSTAQASILTYAEPLKTYGTQFATTKNLIATTDAEKIFLSSFAPSTGIDSNGNLVESDLTGGMAADDMWQCALSSFNLIDCNLNAIVNDKTNIKSFLKAATTLLTQQIGTFCIPLIVNEYHFCVAENLSLKKIEQSINGIVSLGSILQIKNKESLQNIINLYKNNEVNQNKFNEAITIFENYGFRSLNPEIGNYNEIKIENFIERKKVRLEKRNFDFNFVVDTDSTEISIDDELIDDPALASLLNEEREIVVGNDFYKYTEMGLFFCDFEKKDLMLNYLKNLNPSTRILFITEYDPTNAPTIKEITPDIKLFQPESLFSNDLSIKKRPLTLRAIDTYSPQSDLIKENLPICYVDSQGFFEKIFGAGESCLSYMSDGKRVKTKFWNKNYFLFASIGCKVKFQKHKIKWYASWWEKSYANKIELGVNYITYEYNFNVPMYTGQQYNYETTFFEFNGTKYNSYGNVINKVPTGTGNFNFNTSSSQSTLNIIIAGYEVTNENINQVIDIAVKKFVDGIQDYLEKNNIIQKIKNDQIKFNITNAPFGNKVKFISSDIKWFKTNENALSHYFDVNGKIKYKSNYDGIEDYLKGLNGAKKYTNVSADIYGAAYNNGEWRGNRLLLIKK